MSLHSQDDYSILRSRSEVDVLDHMLDQQQRQFADLVHSTVETLDPAIPVTFTKVQSTVWRIGFVYLAFGLYILSYFQALERYMTRVNARFCRKNGSCYFDFFSLSLSI